MLALYCYLRTTIMTSIELSILDTNGCSTRLPWDRLSHTFLFIFFIPLTHPFPKSVLLSQAKYYELSLSNFSCVLLHFFFQRSRISRPTSLVCFYGNESSPISRLHFLARDDREQKCELKNEGGKNGEYRKLEGPESTCARILPRTFERPREELRSQYLTPRQLRKFGTGLQATPLYTLCAILFSLQSPGSFFF